MKENKPINKTIDAMVWTKQISKIYLPIHNNVFTNMPSSFFLSFGIYIGNMWCTMAIIWHDITQQRQTIIPAGTNK